MNAATIFIKTDPKVKEEAQKTAEELGFSLSSIINAYLRQFVKTKSISFSAKELDETPNAATIASLRQSEEDVAAGRVHSFGNPKDALNFINDLITDGKY